jgi:hypothetical protein
MQLNYGSLTIWIWEFGISLLHMILRLLFFWKPIVFLGFSYILIFAEIVEILFIVPTIDR